MIAFHSAAVRLRMIVSMRMSVRWMPGRTHAMPMVASFTW